MPRQFIQSTPGCPGRPGRTLIRPITSRDGGGFTFILLAAMLAGCHAPPATYKPGPATPAPDLAEHARAVAEHAQAIQDAATAADAEAVKIAEPAAAAQSQEVARLEEQLKSGLRSKLLWVGGVALLGITICLAGAFLAPVPW